MSRFCYYGVTKDGTGRVVTSATVSVYLAGTTTPANVYAASVGGVAVNSVISGTDTSSTPGYFIFWVDRLNYTSSQQFKIIITKTGFTPQTYDYINIFAASELLIVSGTPAQGNVVYYNGAAYTVLPVGTSGYLLKTQGVGANPAWTNDLTGLTGLLATNQTPAAHNTTHQTGGSDVLSITGNLISIPSQAAGDILYYNGSSWVRLAKDVGKYLQSGASAPSWATPSTTGKVVQVVNTQTGASTTGTTIIPFDDTIPQNTEGDEYMTLAITPTNAANILYIDVVAMLANSAASFNLIAALFQDSTVDALAVGIASSGSANFVYTIAFRHKMTAGTTLATTFKLRAGAGQAGTTRFNGYGGARIFGGVAASSITITEISAT